MLILAATIATLPPPPPPDEKPPTGLRWFRQADSDRDGFLSFEEFPNRRMFLAFDKDQDSRLSMEELTRAIADAAPPRPTGLPGVETRLDISYRAGDAAAPGVEEGAGDERADPRLTSLDLYIPTTLLEKGERRPIIAYIHGGGWRIGDKSRVHSKPKHYCQRGYVFASINYRLSPAVEHPAHAEDAAAAIAWLHDNAESFGGDPDRIVVMGHSAGAHLAALIATDPAYLRPHGLAPADLAAVVALDSASYDLNQRIDDLGMRRMIREAFGEDPDALAEASPMRHVQPGRDYPPFLIVYAERRPVARRESEQFAEALRRAGAEAQLVAAEDKDHAAVNIDAGIASDPMSEAIDEFLKQATTPPAG